MILSEKDFPLPIGTFTATSGWLEPLNSQPMYEIKPLEWTGESDPKRSEYMSAEPPFGRYAIHGYIDPEEFDLLPFYWEYHLGEDIYEGRFSAETIEAAKAAAETHWQERVKQCLVLVEPQIKELK